jgi:hypothetical protein
MVKRKKTKRQEAFEDTKGVIGSHKLYLEGLTMQWSKENDNSTNNDLQNIIQKTKDRAQNYRTPNNLTKGKSKLISI